MHLFEPELVVGDEWGISHCIFLSSQCTTKVPVWRPWSYVFLFCDRCVVNTSIFRCCRYRKFIWTANIVWIMKDKISISFTNSKIDNQVSWIIYWTFKTFSSIKTKSSKLNLLALLGTLPSVLKLGLNSLYWQQNPSVELGKSQCLLLFVSYSANQ